MHPLQLLSILSDPERFRETLKRSSLRGAFISISFLGAKVCISLYEYTLLLEKFESFQEFLSGVEYTERLELLRNCVSTVFLYGSLETVRYLLSTVLMMSATDRVSFLNLCAKRAISLKRPEYVTEIFRFTEIFRCQLTDLSLTDVSLETKSAILESRTMYHQIEIDFNILSSASRCLFPEEVLTLFSKCSEFSKAEAMSPGTHILKNQSRPSILCIALLAEQYQTATYLLQEYPKFSSCYKARMRLREYLVKAVCLGNVDAIRWYLKNHDHLQLVLDFSATRIQFADSVLVELFTTADPSILQFLATIPPQKTTDPTLRACLQLLRNTSLEQLYEKLRNGISFFELLVN